MYLLFLLIHQNLIIFTQIYVYYHKLSYEKCYVSQIERIEKGWHTTIANNQRKYVKQKNHMATHFKSHNVQTEKLY